MAEASSSPSSSPSASPSTISSVDTSSLQALVPADGATSAEPSGLMVFLKTHKTKILVGLGVLVVVVLAITLPLVLTSGFKDGAAKSEAAKGRVPPGLMNKRWVFIGSDGCPACRQQKQELSAEEVAALYVPIESGNPFFHMGLQYRGRPAVEAIPTWAKFPAGWSLPRIRALKQSWADLPADMSEDERRIIMRELVVDLEDVRVGMLPRQEIDKLLADE